MSETSGDAWAEWLLHRRHGDDPEQLKLHLARLQPIRDRVLDNAGVSAGDTVLDVGAGDGLIAFEALNRVGERGKVIFSDPSAVLLGHCRRLALRTGISNRCEFVQASADDLGEIPPATADAVTVRSVLSYVERREQAFREFYRVLKPGGQLSIYEPINSFGNPEPPHLFWGRDVTKVQDLAMRVRALLEPPEHRVMLQFDDRDMFRYAESAGFEEVHLSFRAEVTRQMCLRWETLGRMALPPPSMMLFEAIERALTPDEARRFTAHLRPLVESGEGRARVAVAYLWAIRA